MFYLKVRMFRTSKGCSSSKKMYAPAVKQKTYPPKSNSELRSNDLIFCLSICLPFSLYLPTRVMTAGPCMFTATAGNALIMKPSNITYFHHLNRIKKSLIFGIRAAYRLVIWQCILLRQSIYCAHYPLRCPHHQNTIDAASWNNVSYKFKSKY